MTPDETGDEICRIAVLRVCLEGAAAGHFDPGADIAPIRALLDQGCDLEADVVPIVARELPELPRPLKNWGAPWLVREILAARDQRRRHQTSDNPPYRWSVSADHRGVFGIIKRELANRGLRDAQIGCRASRTESCPTASNT